MPGFSPVSRQRLGECHSDLQTLMFTAILDSPVDFGIACGHRDEVAQEAACAAGLSKVHWPDSKHNKIPSLAVDIVPYVDKLDVYTWARYKALQGMPDTDINKAVTESFVTAARHILAVAENLGLGIRWGGDFNMDGDKTTKDSWDKPHFELMQV